MSVLSFDKLIAARPDGTRLFPALTLSLTAERVALVGRNGAGKSTLLTIAAGLAEPAGGSVHRAGTVGFLRQMPAAAGSVAEALGAADCLGAIARLEAGAGTAEDAGLADWERAARLEQTLAEAGLGGLAWDAPVAALSGGERTRLALAGLVAERPDILLLDEPTNNMDAEGRAAVHALLAGWPGAVLIASHDRALLETVDRIVHLSPVGVTIFGGGWSEFAAARSAAIGRADDELDRARRAQRQQADRARKRQETQARRDRAGRGQAASGGDPKILLGARKRRAQETAGGLETLEQRQADAVQEALAKARSQVEVFAPVRITLPPCDLSSQRRLLTMDRVTVERAGRVIAGPATLTITGPEHVALTAPNGAGKTTLLRVAAGEIAISSGQVARAEGALALLDQHGAMFGNGVTLVEGMIARHPGMTANAARAALARFGFRNREADRLAETLSGGERLRAALALVFSGPVVPQLLLLDEPTNHLDIDAIAELETALQNYDGALLVVSHDTAFLDAIGIDRTLHL